MRTLAPITLSLLLAACGTRGDALWSPESDEAPAIEAGADSSEPAYGDDGSDGGTADIDDGAGDGATDEAGDDGGSPPAACVGDTLSANRNRLLESYFQYLKANVTAPQTNGLSGGNVASALDLWEKLDPSSQAVFLTLTARMQGSRLGQDSTSMLSHITTVYRVAGGQGANASGPGSCGGGEYNRMIMSMDATLRDALLAAHEHKGAKQSNGEHDVGDVVPSSYWRDSHDLGGPHAPFDRSNETNGGAPRGQVHYFADPTSSRASSPLGRQDLAALVDPNAIEMDQDYDCVHASNPLCTYITYGPLCLPQPPALGTKVYTDSYGSFDPTWQPENCGP